MSHITPVEVITLGEDLRAKTLFPSHWGTISSLSEGLCLNLQNVIKRPDDIMAFLIKFYGY